MCQKKHENFHPQGNGPAVPTGGIMSRIAVRWMGAFRLYGTLADSLRWEFSNTREVAAEWYHGFEEAAQSGIHSQVGLLVNRGAIIRAYNGDV